MGRLTIDDELELVKARAFGMSEVGTVAWECARAERAEAEIERLRAALQKIVARVYETEAIAWAALETQTEEALNDH